MKPPRQWAGRQSPLRNTLKTLKEFPSKNISEKIISCAIAIILIAQILTYMIALNLRVGLLINFNVDKLKDGIRRVIL